MAGGGGDRPTGDDTGEEVGCAAEHTAVVDVAPAVRLEGGVRVAVDEGALEHLETPLVVDVGDRELRRIARAFAARLGAP